MSTAGYLGGGAVGIALVAGVIILIVYLLKASKSDVEKVRNVRDDIDKEHKDVAAQVEDLKLKKSKGDEDIKLERTIISKIDDASEAAQSENKGEVLGIVEETENLTELSAKREIEELKAAGDNVSEIKDSIGASEKRIKYLENELKEPSAGGNESEVATNTRLLELERRELNIKQQIVVMEKQLKKFSKKGRRLRRRLSKYLDADKIKKDFNHIFTPLEETDEVKAFEEDSRAAIEDLEGSDLEAEEMQKKLSELKEEHATKKADLIAELEEKKKEEQQSMLELLADIRKRELRVIKGEEVKGAVEAQEDPLLDELIKLIEAKKKLWDEKQGIEEEKKKVAEESVKKEIAAYKEKLEVEVESEEALLKSAEGGEKEAEEDEAGGETSEELPPPPPEEEAPEELPTPPPPKEVPPPPAAEA